MRRADERRNDFASIEAGRLASRSWWVLVVMLAVARPGAAQPGFRNDLNPFLISGHVALGGGLSSPYVFGTVGVRFEERHVFVGLELSSMFQAGFAADALFYMVRLGPVAVHAIDPGIGWNAFGHYLSTPEVKRSVDLRLGAGAQLRLCRHGWATFDWKVSFPNPGYVIVSYGDWGRSIFSQALKESQLWFGVLIH